MSKKHYIDEIFGPDGLLAQKVSGYEQRSGQVQMAKTIDKIIKNKKHLMVEAPTGTGKSIAYTVPTIFNIKKEKQKAVIVTANIALQEQLIQKDLPQMASMLPWPFTFSLIKGRNNYLCLNKLDKAAKESILNKNHYREKQFDKLDKWSDETETGDKNELDFIPDSQVWELFSSTSDECLHRDCLYKNECFCSKAYKAAHASDIIVCNYHILCAHLLVGEEIILPKFKIIILDEAHKAADIARDFFEWKVSIYALRGAFRMLGATQKEEYLEDAKLFFADLVKYKKSPEYKRRILKKNIVNTSKIISLLEATKLIYKRALEELIPDNGIVHDEKDKIQVKDLKDAYEKCNTYIRRIQKAMDLEDSNAVYYITDSGQLCCKLIIVGDIIDKYLFSKMDTVICTSATLAVNKSFKFITEEIGLNNAQELIVQTPFDFYNQCSLVLPENMPDPRNKEYLNFVIENFSKIVKYTKGSCLGLFTSYKNLDATFDNIDCSQYTLLKQGQAPRTTLVQQFKQNTNSVLLGTESFWSGIDVPGDSLICVIIDKLPFQNLDDPILDAIMERRDNAFINYYVPKAVITFKQGVGRLIRRKNDYGVIVILDPRILTKNYGHYFKNSIPKMLYTDNVNDIEDILKTTKNYAQGKK